jgi:hypothetical protein
MKIDVGQIPVDPGRSAPVEWALAQLADRLRGGESLGRIAVEFELRDDLGPEAYRISVEAEAMNRRVSVAAADVRGFVYALTEAASRVKAEGLEAFRAEGTPMSPVRGIQRAFVSLEEDYGWFHDRRFWRDYLDLMASARFNRFQLSFGMGYNYGADTTPVEDNYLCFAYPFLLDVPGFEVRVQGVDRDERERNLAQLRVIAAETRRRGMDFQLGLWNHAWDYANDAHGHPARQRFPVLGIGRENHAPYVAAAVRLLLEEVPDITGLTFRVHYEGGIPDARHEEFWAPVFQGAAAADRPLLIDLHAKGVDQPLLDAVAIPGLQPILSAKFWAEHMGLPYHQAAIRPQEHSEPTPEGHELTGITEFSRRFTRYGYADFLHEDRAVDVMFRVWPGTTKFLMWGDDAMAAGYGRAAAFAGSRGFEYCEPMFFKGRKGSGVRGGKDVYRRDDLRLGDDTWRKYRYTYATWGEHLYDPDTDAPLAALILAEDHGEAADAIHAALGVASRILPLITSAHSPAASNNGYSPELIFDLPISRYVRPRTYGVDAGPRPTWGGVSPLDPEMFVNADHYVRGLVVGESTFRYTPHEVARWLEGFAEEAQEALVRVRRPGAKLSAQTERVAIDVQIISHLGVYYAHKLRGAVDYAVWERTRARAALERALFHATGALEAFSRILPVVEGIYADDITFGIETTERGHWRLRIADIEADKVALERELADAVPGGKDMLSAPRRAQLPSDIAVHAPERYEEGRAVSVTVTGARGLQAMLRYRPVDQSATWQEIRMRSVGGELLSEIPAEFTRSGFPLQFYIVVGDGTEWDMLPGLETPTLSNQPYYMLRASVR